MSAWASETLTAIDTADELRVSSYRPDGTLRRRSEPERLSGGGATIAG